MAEPTTDAALGEPSKLASLALRLFSVVVVAWGLSGIVAPSLWLHTLIGLAPSDAATHATLVNEFRFLEARELGVGIFSWVLHDEILTSRKHNLAFLAVVFAAPVARVTSCLVDGAPSRLWWLFMGSEMAMALALVVLTRGARGRPR